MKDGVPEAKIELNIGAGPKPGEYSVQVVRAASGGTPRSTFTLDVNALTSQSRSLETVVLASAARARGPVAELEKPLRVVGSRLFQALFAGTIGSAYRSSLAVAHERGKKLQVVLGITAPELAMMPWEALYDDELERYVCRKEEVVRRVDVRYTPDPLPVRPPLRILGIVASPQGLSQLDVDAEKEHLKKALAQPMAADRVQLIWETQASWSTVHDRLLREQWHVLHFIGHGDYDRERGEGRIALVADDGSADWVDATSLADLLGEAEPTPRLVVLNSCASGQGGGHDLFSGTAATLVHSGICAVVAMQFSVSDIAAVRFPRGFYTALANGRRVDEAVRSGRIEILGSGGGTLEWVTPILHVRGDAMELFQLYTASGEPTEVEPPKDQIRTTGKAPQKPEPPSGIGGAPPAPADSSEVSPDRAAATRDRRGTTLKPPGLLGRLWISTLASGLLAVILAIVVLVRRDIEVISFVFGLYLLAASVTQALFGFAMRGPIIGRVLLFISSAACFLLALVVSDGGTIFSHPGDLYIYAAVGFMFRGGAPTVAAVVDRDLPGRSIYIFLGVISFIAGIVILYVIWFEDGAPFESRKAQLLVAAAASLLLVGVCEMVSSFGIIRNETSQRAASR